MPNGLRVFGLLGFACVPGGVCGSGVGVCLFFCWAAAVWVSDSPVAGAPAASGHWSAGLIGCLLGLGGARCRGVSTGLCSWRWFLWLPGLDDPFLVGRRICFAGFPALVASLWRLSSGGSSILAASLWWLLDDDLILAASCKVFLLGSSVQHPSLLQCLLPGVPQALMASLWWLLSSSGVFPVVSWLW